MQDLALSYVVCTTFSSRFNCSSRSGCSSQGLAKVAPRRASSSIIYTSMGCHPQSRRCPAHSSRCFFGGGENLQSFSQILPDGAEPLVGPYISYTVPLLTVGDDGALETAGEDVTVLVVDMNFPAIKDLVVSYPEEGEDLDLILPVGADPFARPDFGGLMPMIKGWVDREVFERTAFYSAQAEDPPAATTPKAGAKAKHLPLVLPRQGKFQLGQKPHPSDTQSPALRNRWRH